MYEINKTIQNYQKAEYNLKEIGEKIVKKISITGNFGKQKTNINNKYVLVIYFFPLR